MNKEYEIKATKALDQARKRIGLFPKKTMLWLLELANTDPHVFEADEELPLEPRLDRLLTEIGYFHRRWDGEYLRQPVFALKMLSPRFVGNDSYGCGVNLYWGKQAHAAVRRHILEFVDKGQTAFREVSLEFILARTTQNPVTYTTFTGASEESFILKIMLVLQDQGHLLRRCEGCQAVFLADRADQTYHNKKCRMTHYMRKKRGTPPDRIGKRGRPPKVLAPKQRDLKTNDRKGTRP